MTHEPLRNHGDPIRRSFAARLLALVAERPCIVGHNGCELAAFPESAGFGYFRRIAPPIRAVSFSPVLARQMWRLEEGDALRVSIVDGFAQFEPGVYYWED